LEEGTVSHVREDEAEEGFSVVRKKIPVTRPRNQQNNEEGGAFDQKESRPKQVKNKGAYLDRNNKVPEGKRQFERQSGTGRGKEVSKGGAGGHHTWGANPKNIAKEGQRQNDEEYNNEDSYFQSALNPRTKDSEKENKESYYSPEKKWDNKRQPYEERTQAYTEKTEAKPEGTTGTDQPKVEGEAVPEENPEWAEKRKKKKLGVVEENKEDLLERPKDAVTLSEYKEQLKIKNQGIATTAKTVEKPKDVNDLKEQTKDFNQYEISAGSAKSKAKPKPKEKKVDAKEQELNSLIGSAQPVEEERWDNRPYDNTKGYGNRKKEAKFKFSANDFPEL